MRRAGEFKPDTASAAEPINLELREHSSAADGWHYRQQAEVLHLWAERFNVEFKLGLSTPAIRIERISSKKLGTYRHGRNGFGLADEITINAHHLDLPLAEQLSTLFHEQLHQWQARFGTCSRTRHHNRQFRDKAMLYGIIVHRRGYHLGYRPGKFTRLLAAWGIDISPLHAPEEKVPTRRVSGQSKMRKWRCLCTTVRYAVELAARCERCGNRFSEAAPSW